MQFEWWRLIDKRDDLIAAAEGEADLAAPAAIDRLNRLAGDEPLARAAVELVRARRKLAEKWPGVEPLVADVAGAEQATDAVVAAHKAARFAALGVDAIMDLCCGIGGDALALAQHAKVRMVDERKDRLWAARYNLVAHRGAGSTIHADVRRVFPTERAFHLDPSRRAESARLHRYIDYLPGPAYIAALLERCPTGAVKLGPGIDVDELPEGEVEFITHHGTLVQAVLWAGELRGATRSATLLPQGQTLAGEPMDVPFDDPRQWLFAVDPAVERSGLIGNLCQWLGLAATHPQLGLLTGDTRCDSPFITAFEHLETLPWRPKRIRQWLKANDGGLVEVKTRGKATDPDRTQRQLRGDGATTYTLFVLRYDRRVVCHITRRA